MKKLKTLSRRGLALFVALLMCATMLPLSAFAAEGDAQPVEVQAADTQTMEAHPEEAQATETQTEEAPQPVEDQPSPSTALTGTVASITEGGKVEGNQVTFGSDTTLEFVADGNDAGRAPNYWWAGIKVTPPEGSGTGKYRKVNQWWTDKGDTVADGAWTEWATNDDQTYWAIVDPTFFDQFGDTLTYRYQFDWNSDGTSDQEVVIKVTKDVTLNYNGEQAAKMGNTLYPTLQAAITAAQENATVVLLQNVQETVTATNKNNITLNLNGKTVNGEQKNTVLTIDGGSVTMTGNGTITGGKSSDYTQGGGVTVTGGGKFTMKSGKIDHNTANQYGGGVMVYHGSFTMVGGAITNNNVSTSGTGGGVCVYNCIEAQTAQFTMNGGTISGNSNGIGGGVGAFHWRLSADRTSVIINGGMITGNTATWGGGVSVSTADSGGTEYRGKININGGTITGNTANLGGGVYASESIVEMGSPQVTRNNASSSGGGVYVQAGEATIAGAEITGNTAKTGGGLYAGHKTRDTTVTMTSGKLYGNTATSHSADVYTNEKTTLTLPAAASMGGKLNDKPITGWFWDGSPRWTEKDNDRGSITMTKRVQALIAAYAQAPVARITRDGTDYDFGSLQTAFNTAADGETVEVLKNTGSGFLDGTANAVKHITVHIPAGCTVGTETAQYALVANGSNAELTVTGEGSLIGRNYGVVVQNGGKLIINGGAISSPQCGARVAGNGSTMISTLVVNGGTITGGTYGVAGNGTRDGTIIEINGGSITGGSEIGAGIYHPQNGTLTITGGEITGNVGVQMCDGNLLVSGENTKITGSGKDESTEKTGDGIIPDGASISLVYRGAAPDSGYGMPSAKITGGLFISQQEKAVATYGWSNKDPQKTEWCPDEGFISGGTFSNDVAEYAADTYASHPIREPEGYYNVHTPGIASDWTHDTANHWHGCSGHVDCLVKMGGETPHNFTSEVTTQPQVGVPGVRTYTCRDCGYNYNESIPALSPPNPVDPPVATTYTVRYTDGVEDEVIFADQVNAGLSYGAATPAFQGEEPVREGYTFGGWEPEVSPTVTRSTTYTAIWEEEIVDPPTPLVVAPGLDTENHRAYINGYGGRLVKPQNNITRAEVATIFYRLMEDSFRGTYWTNSNTFTDVNTGDWFNNAVSTSADAELIKGYGDGTFKGNKAITRAEFAAIAARFIPDIEGNVEDYPDTANHWAAKEIRVVTEAGWFMGDSRGFRPNDPITRAEAMTVVNRMVNRVPHGEDDLLDGMVTWDDNNPGAWYYEAVQEATNSHNYEHGQRGDETEETWTELIPNPDWKALEKEWEAEYLSR